MIQTVGRLDCGHRTNRGAAAMVWILGKLYDFSPIGCLFWNVMDLMILVSCELFRGFVLQNTGLLRRASHH